MRRAAALLGLLLPLAAACAGGPPPAPPGPSHLPPVKAPAVGGATSAGVPDTKPADSLFRGAVSEADLVRHLVVGTARGELGRPYRLGGTGDDEGWDCSALIQFAYQLHGVALPRVSRDQAKAGTEVPRDTLRLLAGDLLTFARRPGSRTVTHVGLYVGEGRFIHSSSSRGVVESALSEGDAEGRWWLRRWVGVRRIVTD